jgi:hypothetical protein
MKKLAAKFGIKMSELAFSMNVAEMVKLSGITNAWS